MISITILLEVNNKYIIIEQIFNGKTLLLNCIVNNNTNVLTLNIVLRYYDPSACWQAWPFTPGLGVYKVELD